MNVALVRTMPVSDRRASDVAVGALVVGIFGAVLAAGYSSVLPSVARDLAHVVRGPVLVAVFAVLVAGTAVNQLTDGLFLSLDRVLSNLFVNGVLMSIAKLGVPFVLFAVGGFGAFGVFGAVDGAALLAAAASLLVILRYLPDRPTLRASRPFRASVRLAGAGYVSNVLYFVPQLVFPVLIIDAQGPTQSAIYFISFQIVTLLNHAVYAVANSMYAECSRHPDSAAAIARKAGRTILLVAVLGIAVLFVLAPALLSVFGGEYSAGGVVTLRVLAAGTVGVAFNYWSAIRLRVAHHLKAMVWVQLFTTALMIGLAAPAAARGVAWVAAAWGIGQFVGGVVGYVASRTVARIAAPEPVALAEAAGVAA